MMKSPLASTENDSDDWVLETRFGKWFQGTEIWNEYVLEDAFAIVRELVGERCKPGSRMLDIGCGQGSSLPMLDKHFEPESINAIDIDPDLLKVARLAGNECRCDVSVQRGSAMQLDFPDNTFDFVCCHQLLHHLADREAALLEFYRVLKPGGMLLLSESCLPFLKVYWVRWLFRHPKMEQKTAEGYIELTRDAGYFFTEKDILETTPWWSLRDLGLLKKLGLQFWQSKTAEISIVATKPE